MPTNTILHYYEGMLQGMRAKVDFINDQLQHQGLKGKGNEKVLRKVLKHFLAKKYAIGTGVVIDRNGTQSKQCDIVIYDNMLYPSILTLSDVHMFPVDIVYATIEIKTTLDAGEAKKALANIASVRALNLIPDDFATILTLPSSSKDAGLVRYEGPPTPPIGAVFAYDSDTQHLDTLRGWFAPDDSTALVGAPQAQTLASPSLVGCLDQGLLLFTDAENRVCSQPLRELDFRAWGLPLWDGEIPLEVVGSGEFTHNGQTYPIKRPAAGTDLYAVEQSRVLLAFLLVLHDLLVHRIINPGLDLINNYFRDTPLLRKVILSEKTQ
jgi:hypothetical protein